MRASKGRKAQARPTCMSFAGEGTCGNLRLQVCTIDIYSFIVLMLLTLLHFNARTHICQMLRSHQTI